ncbi:MAG: DUF4160 domain-containing protein [Holophagaceae bacterium]|nr:DUF4160 domain-containing protein [Holophagaceae bacterium]
MPTISMFYGIIIRMFANEQGHNTPHLHALYGNHKATIDFSGNIIKGKPLPSKQMQLVLAWIAIHKEELEANWLLLDNNEPPFKIDPLR